MKLVYWTGKHWRWFRNWYYEHRHNRWWWGLYQWVADYGWDKPNFELLEQELTDSIDKCKNAITKSVDETFWKY